MRTVSLLCLVICGCRSGGGQDAGPPPILLGLVGALTGAEASFGLTTRDGVILAVEHANADGGVLGRPVVLRAYDSQSRPEQAAQAVTRLIAQDRAVAIIGENVSSSSLAMAPIAQAAKVPMISPSSTNTALTAAGDYIFRACFIDSVQGEAMARHARQTMGLATVAVFTDLKSPYSEQLSRVFSRAFAAAGGTVPLTLGYTSGDTDFRGLLTRLKSASAQAAYVPGYYQDVALIADQARELGLKLTFLGSDGWSSPRLLELAQGALEGAVFSDSFAADDPRPRSLDFLTRFRARFGRSPEGNAALGYDSVNLVLAAIRAAGTTDGAAVRRALAATAGFEGVAGTVTFDSDRNPVKPVMIIGVRDGAFRYQASVQPIGSSDAPAP